MEEFRKCLHCSNPAAPKRRICWKCKTRQHTQKYPIKRIFYDLHHSARRRFIPFKLTLSWFTEWISKTSYLEKRGRGKESLTIDRIREEEGYTPDNIQVLKKSKNVSKYFEVQRRMQEAQWKRDNTFLNQLQ